MARIGIFGGSFNPVHTGHVIVALRSMEQALLDRLLVVPASLAPHKTAAELLPASLRVDLLNLAFAGANGVQIETLELERGGVSYTIDTVRELSRRHPGHEWFLLVGGDSVAGLRGWREAEALSTLVTFLVHPRGGLETGRAPPGFAVLEVSASPVGISSTDVRARAFSGKPVAGLVPESVEARLTRFLGESR